MENNAAALGGRQITMFDGFADAFRELGHDVKIYSNFLQGHIPKKEKLLDYHLAPNLSMDDFEFSYPIQRHMPEELPLREWSRGDLLLIPYLDYSWLGDYVSCPIVSWAIAQPGKWYPEHLTRIWTNSHTQKKLLGLDEARVVYAPHDYSLFRDQAKPWEERKIDVLVTAKYRHSWFGGKTEGAKILKDEIAEAETLYETGLNVVGIFLVKDRKDILELLDNVSFEHYINLPRRYVAGFMASSKVLFHPSTAESCSLMIYEGQNAGCIPIVRETGACREQMGDVGLVYTDFEEAKRRIKEVLKTGYNIDTSMKQGVKFDRVSNIETLKEELEYVKSQR